MSKAEGITWEFHGAVRSPDKTRALVSLSVGGTDAVEIREFEIASRSFVKDGFLIPQAKGSAEWLDADTLLLNSPLNKQQATEAGYGRTVRKWRRGTPIETAEVVFEVEKQAVGAWFDVNHRPGSERDDVLARDRFHAICRFSSSPKAARASSSTCPRRSRPRCIATISMSAPRRTGASANASSPRDRW